MIIGMIKISVALLVSLTILSGGLWSFVNYHLTGVGDYNYEGCAQVETSLAIEMITQGIAKLTPESTTIIANDTCIIAL